MQFAPSSPQQNTAAINPTALATGALGVTVALAWNDAVLTAIDAIFPRAADGRRAAAATAAYAVAVTLFVVAAAAVFNAVAARELRGPREPRPRVYAAAEPRVWFAGR